LRSLSEPASAAKTTLARWSWLCPCRFSLLRSPKRSTLLVRHGHQLIFVLASPAVGGRATGASSCLRSLRLRSRGGTYYGGEPRAAEDPDVAHHGAVREHSLHLGEVEVKGCERSQRRYELRG
jgi:hypothetical protein